VKNVFEIKKNYPVNKHADYFHGYTCECVPHEAHPEGENSTDWQYIKFDECEQPVYKQL